MSGAEGRGDKHGECPKCGADCIVTRGSDPFTFHYKAAVSSIGAFTQREAYLLLRALDFCLNPERDMLDLNPTSEWTAVQAKVLALSKNDEPRELPAAAANPLPSASVRTNDAGMREAATSAQQPAGSSPCTCYVLPHEDDCGIFVGITQSGERVMERRSGADRRYFATSAIEPKVSEEALKFAEYWKNWQLSDGVGVMARELLRLNGTSDDTGAKGG